MAKQTWESCIYTAEEAWFCQNYLGPTLKNAGLGDKKLPFGIIIDLSQRASTILDDPQASKYVWGIGFHWYESWSGGDPMFDNVGKVHEMYPDKTCFYWRM
jgi:glucosylceramidase